MKTKLLAMVVLAGGSMFTQTASAQTRFSVGVNIGGVGLGYYQSAPAYAVVPPCPGPDYSWIDGYWSSNRWINGYWFRQPYVGGFNRGTRFDRGFNNGFSNGFRGEVRDRDRNFGRDRDSRGFTNNDRGNNSRGNDNRGTNNRGNNSTGNNDRGRNTQQSGRR
jgi:hypothetical protein